MKEKEKEKGREGPGAAGSSPLNCPAQKDPEEALGAGHSWKANTIFSLSSPYCLPLRTFP